MHVSIESIKISGRKVRENAKEMYLVKNIYIYICMYIYICFFVI